MPVFVCVTATDGDPTVLTADCLLAANESRRRPLRYGALCKMNQKALIAIVIDMFRLAGEYATVKIPLSPFEKGGKGGI